jgi:lipopolysaccharide export system protein LptA
VSHQPPGDRSTTDRPLWILKVILAFIVFGGNIVLPSQLLPVLAQKPKRTAQAQPNPQPNSQGLAIQADTQEANSKTQVVTARGNVRLNYPSRQLRAQANLAQYYIKQKRIVLTGNVLVVQNGNTLAGESVIYLIEEGKFIANPKVKQQVRSNYIIPEQGGKGLTIQSNSQEANTKSKIVTASGNVRLNYPDKKLQARANLAEYKIGEKQIVLSGDVFVVQDGSSLQGDTITYLIEEGRFIAKQKPGIPVQSIYVIPDEQAKE